MPSPDGRHFLFVTVHGNLATGKREATLWLVDSTELRGGAAKPRALAVAASASARPPLAGWRWTDDSTAVLFLSADDDGVYRLNRMGLDESRPKLLSFVNQDVSSFDERAGRVAYLAHVPVRPDDLYRAGGAKLPDIEVGSGKSLVPLLFPKWLDTVLEENDDELWKVEKGQAMPVMVGSTGKHVLLRASDVALSPDGSQVVATTFVKNVPKSWERYRSLSVDGLHFVADTPETEGATGWYRARQFSTVNLESGAVVALMNAPIDWFNLFFWARTSNAGMSWSPDSSQVALVAAYPELNSAAAPAGDRTVLPCAIMVVRVSVREATCALEGEPDSPKVRNSLLRQIVALRWRDERHLDVEYAPPGDPNDKAYKSLEESNDRWTSRDGAPPAAVSGLRLEVRQALDESPKLMARLNKGPWRVVFDPNPQLQDIALGTAEIYHWRDPDNDEWMGALVKPPGFDARRRYPLIVQTHGLEPHAFLVDGPSPTGYAARAFAGRDILVLQVDEANKKLRGTEESALGAAGYRAGVEQLVQEGHVDPTKVGIIAWSHYGPYVMESLIDQPTAYAAATLAEASNNGYGEYLKNVDYMGSQEREQMFADQFGAKPFGEGLWKWLERSPSFREGRICTPILMQINTPASLVYVWDAYAELRGQNKPVDLLYIRNGDHALVKPWERLVEQGMNVDWYDYWLNGHRDPDPKKAEQYKRWDALKELRHCPAGPQ